MRISKRKLQKILPKRSRKKRKFRRFPRSRRILLRYPVDPAPPERLNQTKLILPRKILAAKKSTKGQCKNEETRLRKISKLLKYLKLNYCS